MSLETAERRPPPFDAVLKFKIRILQRLYNLSDDQTKYQVRDRLSFLRFFRLDLDHRIPADKTIWLFREALTEARMMKTLFEQFETSLAPNGLQARGKIHYKGSRKKARPLNSTLAIEPARGFAPESNMFLGTRSPRWVGN